MPRWWCLVLLVHAPTTFCKNVRQAQIDGKECCPCPKDGSLLSDVPRYDLIDASGGLGTCVCPPFLRDAEPSATVQSTSQVHYYRPASREPEPSEESKPLLHPEVDFASSVLKTLHQATDEEYREALERDAARTNAEESKESDETDTSEPPTNLVTIVLNNPEIYDMDDTAGEESHVHEARCAPFHLGDQISLSTPKSSFLSNLFQPIQLDEDQGLAASNVRESVTEVDRSKQPWKLFPKLNIPNLSIQPIADRFTEARNNRMRFNDPTDKSDFPNSKYEIGKEYLNTKDIQDLDSNSAASNANEMTEDRPIHCAVKGYSSNIDLNNNPQNVQSNLGNDASFSKITFGNLAKQHQERIDKLSNKIKDNNERLTSLIREPIKHKINIQIEPMKLEKSDDLNAKVSEQESNYEIIDTSALRIKDSITEPSSNINCINLPDQNIKEKSLADINKNKDILESDKTPPSNDPNFSLNPNTEIDKNQRYVSNDDLEAMSNMLLEKSNKHETKTDHNSAHNNEYKNTNQEIHNLSNERSSPLTCIPKTQHKMDATGRASEKIIKSVPYSLPPRYNPRNGLETLKNNLIVQPESLIGDGSSLFNINNNPFNFELPSLDDVRERIENFFNLYNDVRIPDVSQMKSAENAPTMKFRIPPLQLQPQQKEEGSKFNLQLFNLNPIIPELGKARESINTGLNLNTFKSNLPGFNALPIKPLKLESFKKTSNGNIIGASWTFNDIDSHFKKVKSDLLKTPALKQMKQFASVTQSPKSLVNNLGLPINSNIMTIGTGKQLPSAFKKKNMDRFPLRQKPLNAASINVPSLKPLPLQSQNNIVGTNVVSKFGQQNVNKNFQSMDPNIKAAIVHVLSTTKIPESTTISIPKSITKEIAKGKTQTPHPLLLKEPDIKMPYIKPLKKSLSEIKPIKLKNISTLRNSNFNDLSRAWLLRDNFNILPNIQNIENNKSVRPKPIRERKNKLKSKEGDTLKKSPNIRTLGDKQISPKPKLPTNSRSSLLKTDITPSRNNKHSVQTDSGTLNLKGARKLKGHQLRVTSESDLLKKLTLKQPLSNFRDLLRTELPLHKVDIDTSKLGHLFGSKIPKLQIPHSLSSNQLRIPSPRSRPPKIVSAADLRGSADTNYPITAWNNNADNEVQSSNNVHIKESVINLQNKAAIDDSNLNNILQRSKGESGISCSAENLGAVTKETKTTILNNLKNSIKTSFAELHSRVNKDLNRLSKTATNNENILHVDGETAPSTVIESVANPEVPLNDLAINHKIIKLPLVDDLCEPLKKQRSNANNNKISKGFEHIIPYKAEVTKNNLNPVHEEFDTCVDLDNLESNENNEDNVSGQSETNDFQILKPFFGSKSLVDKKNTNNDNTCKPSNNVQSIFENKDNTGLNTKPKEKLLPVFNTLQDNVKASSKEITSKPKINNDLSLNMEHLVPETNSNCKPLKKEVDLIDGHILNTQRNAIKTASPLPINDDFTDNMASSVEEMVDDTLFEGTENIETIDNEQNYALLENIRKHLHTSLNSLSSKKSVTDKSAIDDHNNDDDGLFEPSDNVESTAENKMIDVGLKTVPNISLPPVLNTLRENIKSLNEIKSKEINDITVNKVLEQNSGSNCEPINEESSEINEVKQIASEVPNLHQSISPNGEIDSVALSSEETVDDTSCEGSENIKIIVNNESTNNDNQKFGLIDKIGDHAKTSLKSLSFVTSNAREDSLTPKEFRNSDIYCAEKPEKLREGSSIERETQYSESPAFTSILDRIRSSLDFMNRGISTNGFEDTSISEVPSDSTFEASNDEPSVVNDGEAKSDNVEEIVINNCDPSLDTSDSFPASLCGTSVPGNNNVTYKCRLVCTKE